MNCLHEKYEIILSFITKTLCLITLRKPLEILELSLILFIPPKIVNNSDLYKEENKIRHKLYYSGLTML